ncbi:hypothetical protein IDH50_01625 [Aeromicrobium tamlense]|uniref:Uncharacterized protein n=1 Tax=Aeromicrobium tamlense TaxID=375541 RepID=A0A8I0FUA9_9ACTN|nr:MULTISPECIES: hypothetical protein [Aeromicrobium]MBD1268921.1 hypothetical protein [Aeromicrobium tamlense]NYI37171.1 hypothetical protein [Aeromicrobium tamlense]
MTEPIARPVSQLRAGDLIAPDDEGTVYVVCAVSQPVGTSRRAELVDARTGEAGRCVRLQLHDAVLTVPGRAQWVVVAGGEASESLLVGADFHAGDERHHLTTWDVEIDLLGRPGWEQLRRGPRLEAARAA